MDNQVFHSMPRIGEKVIMPPAPKTLKGLAERRSSDLEMIDWSLAKKPLSLQIIT